MLDLPRLGIGCAPIGGLLGAVSEADARATLDFALANGARYFDTAPFYGFGLSERRLGEALRPHKDIIVSTKVGRLLKAGRATGADADAWPIGLPFRPEYDYTYDGVMRSYEDSLQRLGRDRVDILFLHDIGSFTHSDAAQEAKHFKDAMEGGYKALAELRSAGAISAIGIGVNELDVSLRALAHGDWDVFLLAGRYTLLETGALAELFPKCAARGTKIIIGGPYNSGVLVGGDTWNYGAIPPEVQGKVARLRAFCAEQQVPLPAAAIQFPLAHPLVESVIPGARTPAELQQTFDWLAFSIPPDFWQALKTQNLLDPSAPTP